MSRTTKKKKAPGTEYWGKRPGNKGGQSPGKRAKSLTKSKERMIKKKIIRKEVEIFDDY